MKIAVWLLSFCVTGMACLAPLQAAELQTVAEIDLRLYAGLWYEIASIPAVFQNPECAGTTASYTLNPDGSIKVWNQCYLPSQRRLERIEGRAVVADPISRARLKVSFFGPFAGDYWVLDLDSSYRYAVVGHPSRNFLWILSRTPQMDAGEYHTILNRLVQQGYDIQRLRRTPSLAEALRYRP